MRNRPLPHFPRFLLPCAGFVAFSLALADPPPPTYPQWWMDAAVVAAQPPDPVAEPTPFAAWMAANYQPANLGQLKNVAAAAKAHLDEALAGAGGAGAAIDDLVDGFDDSQPENFAPINLGQLKAVAQLFYDRLLAVGFDPRADLIAHGYDAAWLNSYPWLPAPPASGEPGYDATAYNSWMAQNYRPANLGQLKLVFSFALPADYTPTSALDADGDGLSTVVEAALGTNPAVADTDGDGASDGYDALPLDANLFELPGAGGPDIAAPQIALLTPQNAVLVSSE